jgi:alpha-tubulin suppressor-like RCC1 family protein
MSFPFHFEFVSSFWLLRACRGKDAFGVLGDGSIGTTIGYPRLSGAVLQFKTFSLGLNHHCGIDFNDFILCWGANAAGQVGDGSGVDQATPVSLGGGMSTTTWSTVSCGWEFTTAIELNTGNMYTWGRDKGGNLGSGTSGNIATPQLVSGSYPAFVSVAAGESNLCARTVSNEMYVPTETTM